ncbi:MAG TPA: transcriptional regulator, partial [Streptosporangiaceae bacterium]|nr:transcriptional regulator [Streptosporangiaceae bacterium]
ELAAQEIMAPASSKVLAFSYQAVASILSKVGESDLALIAADRGLSAAERSGIAPVRASLIRCMAFTLHSTGRFEAAMRLVDAGTDYVNREIRGDDAVLTSVCGTLFLVGSMAAARSGDRTKTGRYLEQATVAAGRLGRDANHLWTAFGPTNVAIHRVNTAVELGDARTALRSTTLAAHTKAIPSERRVRYLLDVARAHSMAGDRDDALGTLLTAEKIAPEQVQQHYLSRKVVMALTRNAIRRPSAELANLAKRMKVGELG